MESNQILTPGYVGRHSSSVHLGEVVISNVSVWWSLKGLTSLHLNLWQFEDLCCTDTFSFSVCQVVAVASEPYGST